MHPMKMRKKPTAAIDAEGVTRITVSVPTPDYEHLLRVAESKRVSMAWVVRDAVEKYLTADMPLFAREERPSQ
jgi:Ribbon-helix-helix protein, copG family